MHQTTALRWYVNFYRVFWIFLTFCPKWSSQNCWFVNAAFFLTIVRMCTLFFPATLYFEIHWAFGFINWSTASWYYIAFHLARDSRFLPKLFSHYLSWYQKSFAFFEQWFSVFHTICIELQCWGDVNFCIIVSCGLLWYYVLVLLTRCVKLLELLSKGLGSKLGAIFQTYANMFLWKSDKIKTESALNEWNERDFLALFSTFWNWFEFFWWFSREDCFLSDQ